MNDMEEYVGAPAPTELAQAQNAIIFRLITAPAFIEPDNIRKLTELEQRRFDRSESTPDRPRLEVFLPSHCFLWAQRDRDGERLTDDNGRSMVRGVQLALETLRYLVIGNVLYASPRYTQDSMRMTLR